MILSSSISVFLSLPFSLSLSLSLSLRSKHAMHCDVAEQVVYSGEFVIMKDDKRGGWVFVIDNNSGTYSPNKLILGKVKELFERNFPGLEVDAISYDDPKCGQNKEKVKENIKLRNPDDWKEF